MDEAREATLEHGWDEAPEGAETGPHVTVTLPDQQPLVGQLVEQRQGSAGDWFCLVALSVWEHVRVQDADAAQATTIISPVPARYVERIEGERYEDVPTRRHPNPRPRAVGGNAEPRFRLQHLSTSGRNLLHLDGTCWRIDDEKTPLVTREEALLALTDPVTQPRIDLCDICKPGDALHAQERLEAAASTEDPQAVPRHGR